MNKSKRVNIREDEYEEYAMCCPSCGHGFTAEEVISVAAAIHGSKGGSSPKRINALKKFYRHRRKKKAEDVGNRFLDTGNIQEVGVREDPRYVRLRGGPYDGQDIRVCDAQQSIRMRGAVGTADYYQREDPDAFEWKNPEVDPPYFFD